MTASLQALLMAATTDASAGPVWTQRALSSSKRWAAVGWGGNVFVVGGLDATLGGPCAAYSTDNGATWTESPTSFSAASGYGFRIFCMDYGNGGFLGAVSPTNAKVSSDGINWSNAGSFSGDPSNVFFAPNAGHFVMVVVNQSYCNVSTSGSSFSQQTLPSSNTWSCGAENSSAGVRVIAANQNTAVSSNGTTWSAGGDMPWSGGTRTMAFGNGTFVATPIAAGNKVAYSTDNGATWSFSNALGGGSYTLMRVVFSDGYFLVFDQGGQNIANSADGVTWSFTASKLPAAMASFTADAAADNARHYVCAGNAGSNTSVVASGAVA